MEDEVVGRGRSLLLGYSGTTPSIVLIDPVSGTVRPFASPVDQLGGAADRMYRCGDGVLISAAGLFGIDAGLQGPMIRHEAHGMITEQGFWWRRDERSYQLISWHGDMRVRLQLEPGTRLLATTADGFVIHHGGTSGFVRPDGTGLAFGGAGPIRAAGADHVVRIAEMAELQVVEIATGTSVAVERPEDITGWAELGLVVDPAGQHLALAGWSVPLPEDRHRRASVLFVLDLASGVLERVQRIDGPQRPVWSTDGDTLFVGDVYHERLHVVDVATAAVTHVVEHPMASSPKVDVGDLAPPIDEVPRSVALPGPRLRRALTIEHAEADFAERVSRLPEEVQVRARSLALPSLRLVRADDQHPRPGATKVGGQPDLPAHVSWPAKGGVPLAFLAQLSLPQVAEMLPSAIPHAGLLLFFFGPFLEGVEYPVDDESAVVLVGPDQELATRPWPEALPDRARYTPVVAEPVVEMTVRRDLDAGWLDDLWEELEITLTGPTTGPLHRILGFPDPIQGAPMGDLVLQLDGDAEVGWTWNDGGRVFFTVDDLQGVPFDPANVRGTVESH